MTGVNRSRTSSGSGDLDGQIHFKNTASLSFDNHFSLSGTSENSFAQLPSSPALAGGDYQFGLSDQLHFGDHLTTPDNSALGLAANSSTEYGQSNEFSSLDNSFETSSRAGGSDGGEFWAWFGLNSFESASLSSSLESEVDKTQYPASQLSYDDDYNHSNTQSTPSSPTTPPDYHFDSAYSAQPYSHTNPFIYDQYTNSFNSDSIDYTSLFGIKPSPSPADQQLFNGGAISTGLIFPTVPDHSAGYRDQYANLDASLCSPLDVSPPNNAIGDFGSSLMSDFSPDETFSQLATPQLDFSHLNVDNDIDSAPLFGALPGQDLLVDVPVTQPMVSIKEEIEEDQLDSESATPDLEEAWVKPTAHNTRHQKRKHPDTSEPGRERSRASSSSVEPVAPPTKRARRASSHAPPVLPLDAPIQPRKYNGDSKTSRKVLPKAIERSLGRDARNRDPADLQADVDTRRSQNTLAARKSRQRKADEVNNLKHENTELRDELARYKAKFGQL